MATRPCRFGGLLAHRQPSHVEHPSQAKLEHSSQQWGPGECGGWGEPPGLLGLGATEVGVGVSFLIIWVCSRAGSGVRGTREGSSHQDLESQGPGVRRIGQHFREAAVLHDFVWELPFRPRAEKPSSLYSFRKQEGRQR